MQTKNPFTGKPLRCFYDKAAQKWWFSAVDICAMLTDKSYDDARQHWKRLKYQFRKRGGQPVGKSDQLKLPAANGKYYYTDVLDIIGAIYLIQVIPNPNADPYRLWLAEMVANNTNIEDLLAEAGAEDAKQIEEHKNTMNTPYQLQTITREEIPIP